MSCAAHPAPSEDRARTRGGAAQPDELRVLRYLPTNLSRPEIAGELCVSVNTVNTHIRNIYAKLQAPSTAAVQRARRLRLIGAGRPVDSNHQILVMRFRRPVSDPPAWTPRLPCS